MALTVGENDKFGTQLHLKSNTHSGRSSLVVQIGLVSYQFGRFLFTICRYLNID